MNFMYCIYSLCISLHAAEGSVPGIRAGPGNPDVEGLWNQYGGGEKTTGP